MKPVVNLKTILLLTPLFLVVSVAHAIEVSLEADLLGPVLRLGGRTGVEQHWISPGIVIDDRIIVRGEFFRVQGTNFSSSSMQQGASGQVGEQNVDASMRGASLGYCFSGCDTHSFRALVGLGFARREFSDTVLGSQFSNGSMWFAEVGYQWRWGNAMTSVSWTALRSDLNQVATYRNATAELSIRKDNSENFFKWGVGFYF